GLDLGGRDGERRAVHLDRIAALLRQAGGLARQRRDARELLGGARRLLRLVDEDRDVELLDLGHRADGVLHDPADLVVLGLGELGGALRAARRRRRGGRARQVAARARDAAGGVERAAAAPLLGARLAAQRALLVELLLGAVGLGVVHLGGDDHGDVTGADQALDHLADAALERLLQRLLRIQVAGGVVGL